MRLLKILERAFYFFTFSFVFGCSSILGNLDVGRHGLSPGGRLVTPTKMVSFETDEGTFMNIDISPDGETLVFDMLGDLYLLPMDGGEAVPLTSGMAWDQAPRFSPDGNSVYFVSDRHGFKNIWRKELADKSIKRVSFSESDILGTPNWDHSRSKLFVGIVDPKSTASEVILHSIDPNTGKMEPMEDYADPLVDMNTGKRSRQRVLVYSAVQASLGDWGSSAGQIFFSESSSFFGTNPRTTVRLFSLDPITQKRTAITSADARYTEFKPQISHSGKLLSYFRQYRDGRTELRLLNLVTGDGARVFDLTNAGDAFNVAWEGSRPNFAFTRDDQAIVFWQNGKIYRVSLQDGSSDIIPFEVKVEREVSLRVNPAIQKIADQGAANIIRWPMIGADEKIVVFAAIGYLWVMDNETDEIRRVTHGTDFEYMPALSPDGLSVAYTSVAQRGKEFGPGRLMVADIRTGKTREILEEPAANYILPKWSGDGKKIALVKEVLNESGAVVSIYGWTSEIDPRFHEILSAPISGGHASLFSGTRNISFTASSDRMLVSYPVSGQQTILESISLDGSSRHNVASVTSEVLGIVPSPDLKKLILSHRDGTVWLLPFDAGVSSARISTLSPSARLIREAGGLYQAWQGTDKIIFGLGKDVFQYDFSVEKLSRQSIPLKFEKPHSGRTIAFTGAHLVTIAAASGAEPVIDVGSLVFKGGRIVAVGGVDEVVIPSDAVIVDVSGKTIIPGLIDTHYHTIGGQSPGRSGFSALKLPHAGFSDPTAILYGVTSAWEPAGPVDDGAPAIIDLQISGRILGPRWSHSAQGGVGHPYEYLTTYEAALAAVRRHKALGVETLKEYLVPTREQRLWLSDAARASGVGIVSHLDSFDGMLTRAVDGYTGGDHPHVPVPFFKDVNELLRQTGFIWTPNVVITSGTLGAYGDKGNFYWQEVLKRRSDELEKYNRSVPYDAYKIKVSEPSESFEVHRASRVAKAAAEAANSGASIGVSAHNLPAARLHREMWYMHKGGMPIADVLRAATMTNAEKIGWQEEVGSLEKGKLADFLILDDNPLDDILNTLSIKYTIQGGVIYDADTADRVDPMDLPLCTDEIRGQDVCRDVTVH